MVDSTMDLDFPTTAKALGEYFDASVVGDATAEVHGLAPLPKAVEGTLSFCNSRKYGGVLNQLKGAILFTRSELVRPELPLTYIVVNDPQAAFAEVARAMTQKEITAGISPQASVHPKAVLGKGVSVEPFAVVCEGARLLDGAIIHAHAYVGPGVEVGEKTEIFPHVVLLQGVKVGNRVKIFPGAVLGSDGFGLVQDKDGIVAGEMPQLGTVIIEDNVRIGAKCTIDRATLGETRIGEGSKLDDQVHIAHNVVLGKGVILCAQVGIAGSSKLGNNVVLAGQVGIADHVTIGDGARMGGQSGTNENLEGGQDYHGSPAAPILQTQKSWMLIRRLPELARRLKKLENMLLPKEET